jgi:hypothetical protein
MIGGTTAAAFAIANKHGEYAASQDYHDHYKQSDDYKVAYAVAYDKNLAELNAFVDAAKENVPNAWSDFLHGFSDNGYTVDNAYLYFTNCYSTYTMQPNTKINREQFCQIDKLSEALDKMPDTYYGGMFMNNTKNLFDSYLSFNDIYAYFQNIAKYVCNHGISGDWFVQSSNITDTLIATYSCQSRGTCKVEAIPAGIVKLHVNRIDLNVSCLTENVKKIVEQLNHTTEWGITIPDALLYPQSIIAMWSVGIACSWVTYIFMILFGLVG